MIWTYIASSSNLQKKKNDVIGVSFSIRLELHKPNNKIYETYQMIQPDSSQENKRQFQFRWPCQSNLNWSRNLKRVWR